MHDLRWLTRVPIACVSAVLLVAVASPRVAESAALPLAMVGLLVGIPHGAIDHLIPWWWWESGRLDRRRDRSTRRVRRDRSVAWFAFAYAATAAVAFSALLVAPTPTLVGFLLLSALHFGRGEVVTSAERAGRPLPGQQVDLPVVAAHGLVVVGLLLWSRPADVRPILDVLSPALADGVAATREPGLLLVASAVAVALATLLWRRRWLEMVELVLLSAVFVMAPPLAAFGVYFGAWHAVRHTGRLLDLARWHHPTSDGWGRPGVVLARAAALPTTAAVLAVTSGWLLRDEVSLATEVGVLLALTLPHAAVVWAYDRARPAAAEMTKLAIPGRRRSGHLGGEPSR